MTCRKCKHQFCWVCIKPYTEHSEHYDCNLFKEEDDEEDSQESYSDAKIALDRYLHVSELL